MTVYVSSVEIRNLRGVKEGVIDGFNDLTVLVGRNGAGKSTVLEALYLVSAWMNPKDSLRGSGDGVGKYDYVLRRRGGRGDWLTSRYVLWHSMNTEEDIVIKLKVGNSIAEFILHYRDPSLWLKLSESWKSDLVNYLRNVSVIIRYDLLRLEDNLARLSNYPPPYNLASVDRGAVITWLRSRLPELFKVLSNTVLIDDYLLSRPSLIEAYSWPKVLARRLDKLVIDVLRGEFEVRAEGLTYAPIGGSNVLMLQLSDTSVRIDDLGDGARLAMLTMLTILASKPKLLLIEEPETRMHPRGMKVLMEAILRLAKEFNTQVITTTHSLEFVKIALKVAEELGINSSLIHLERGENGTLTTRRLSKPDIDLLTDLGIDPRFLDLF